MRSLIIRLFILLGLIFPAIVSAVTPMVAAGSGTTVALKSDGTVWAWGNSAYSANWGDGTTPVAVPGLTGVVAVRLANEGAIRANITQLIDELFRLKIGSIATK